MQAVRKRNDLNAGRLNCRALLDPRSSRCSVVTFYAFLRLKSTWLSRSPTLGILSPGCEVERGLALSS